MSLSISTFSRCTALLTLGLLSGCGGSGGAQAADTPAQPTPTGAVPTAESGPQVPSTQLPTQAPVAAPSVILSHGTASASVPSASGAPKPPSAPLCAAGSTYVAGGSYQRAGTKAPSAVEALCIDTLETTVVEYGECASEGKCVTAGLDCSAQATWNKPGKEQQPIVCIDYDQAAAYCNFRGKRLPTLEEWEWVARGGDEARTFAWGNEPPNEQLCWTGKQRQTESCAVGTHPADKSAAGVLDMAGNVLEFVTTERDARSPVRIAKGGAWNGGDVALFTNVRLGGFRKEYRCGFLGVRCVAPAATQPAATQPAATQPAATQVSPQP